MSSVALEERIVSDLIEETRKSAMDRIKTILRRKQAICSQSEIIAINDYKKKSLNVKPVEVRLDKLSADCIKSYCKNSNYRKTIRKTNIRRKKIPQKKNNIEIQLQKEPD